MLQQIADGVDVVVNQLIALVLGLASCRIFAGLFSPTLVLTTRVSSPALPWLVHPLQS